MAGVSGLGFRVSGLGFRVEGLGQAFRKGDPDFCKPQGSL